MGRQAAAWVPAAARPRQAYHFEAHCLVVVRPAPPKPHCTIVSSHWEGEHGHGALRAAGLGGGPRGRAGARSRITLARQLLARAGQTGVFKRAKGSEQASSNLPPPMPPLSLLPPPAAASPAAACTLRRLSPTSSVTLRLLLCPPTFPPLCSPSLFGSLGASPALAWYSRVQAVRLEWTGLTYSVTLGRGKHRTVKTILDGVSGVAQPGQLLALMGPTGEHVVAAEEAAGPMPPGMLNLRALGGTAVLHRQSRSRCPSNPHPCSCNPALTGSGKSSLLNALAGRLPAGGSLEGHVLANGAPRDAQFRSISAFVLQASRVHAQSGVGWGGSARVRQAWRLLCAPVLRFDAAS